MPKNNKKDYINLISFFLKNMSKRSVKEVFEKSKDLWIREIAENIKEEPPDECVSSSRDSP